MINKSMSALNNPIYSELIKQKDEQMYEKINKSLEKQRHILMIEQQMEVKARKKNEEIVRKINKSYEIKQKNLAKIKEKCHSHLQYQQEKITAIKKNEKEILMKSWMKSKRLAGQILKHKTDHSKSVSPQNKNIRASQTGSHLKNELKKSLNLPYLAAKTPIAQSRINVGKSRIKSERSNNQYFSLKTKENEEVEQAIAVHRIGEKLSKIERTRLKKQKLQEQRQKKIQIEIELRKEKRDQINENKKQHINKKYGHHKSNTMGLEGSGLSKKNMLFKKWEEENKIRQGELFEQRLKKGEMYVISVRDKCERNKMIKQIELNSIEKKLYLERLNNRSLQEEL